MSGLEDELNDTVSKMAAGLQAAEMTSYAIWGAAVTTTRAFGKVSMRVDPNNQRIFVAITLRWFAKLKKLQKLRDAWLIRAERRCKEHIPEGWKLLIYYGGEDEQKL